MEIGVEASKSSFDTVCLPVEEIGEDLSALFFGELEETRGGVAGNEVESLQGALT